MGRKIRTDIPTAKNLLTPNWPYLADFQERDREYKAKQNSIMIRDIEHKLLTLFSQILQYGLPLEETAPLARSAPQQQHLDLTWCQHQEKLEGIANMLLPDLL